MLAGTRTMTVVRWIARVLAAALFFFWGAFFVEHLWEWFIEPLPQTPPTHVWIAQFLHLLVLVGLVVGFRWELAGGILVVVASVLYLWDKAPQFIPLTMLPGLLYLICWYNDRQAGGGATSAA